MSEEIVASFAQSSDVADIVDFLLKDFVIRESLTNAIHTKPEEIRSFISYLTEKGVKSGTSVVLRNEKGEVVGTRLSSFLERDHAEDGDENTVFHPKAGLIGQLLDRVSGNKWSLVPNDVNKLFYIIIISVSSSYGRRGLGKLVIEYGMDEVRKEGAQGFIAEATAMNSQMLFAKLGYDVLKTVRHEDYVDGDGKRIFNCTDGTQAAELVFKRM